MTRHCQLCIVGGGPAGLFAGLLFARAGVETLVIEKHNDFLRDFRGDTVHPSTLELFAQLGLLESLLALPHDRVETIGGRIMGEMLTVADFRHLDVPAPYIALMPQWDLLAFIAAEAQHYPNFTLRMNCEATGITTAPTGRVTGVKIADGEDISADLVIAADGRGSVIRTAAALPLETIGAPMDVFWFRVAKHPADANTTFGVFENGRIGVFIDRGDYWQAAFVFAKGGAQALRSGGLDAFKATVTDTAPELAHGIAALAPSWPARDRRCGACDVADRRGRDQSRDPGRGGSGQCARRANRGGCQFRCAAPRGAGTPLEADVRCSKRCRDAAGSRRCGCRRCKRRHRTG